MPKKNFLISNSIRIAVYSAGRSDFDRFLPILNEIKNNRHIRSKISFILSQSHFSSIFGDTYKEVSKHGFSFTFRDPKINIFSKLNYSEIISSEIKFIDKELTKLKPDIFFVLGDRYEIIAAPIAALSQKIPIGHFYGGSVTSGSLDENIRHAVSKMSHLHFVAHQKYKKRLLQMGEESWRVSVIGVPALKLMKKVSKEISHLHFKNLYKLDIKIPTALITFHPTTNETFNTDAQIKNLLQALKKTELQLIFSYPNADKGFQKIIRKIEIFSKKTPKSIIIKNCGMSLYSYLLANCKVIIGNSSSGIVESSNFKIPSVNIGQRQNGKVQGINVINVDYNSKNIFLAIKRALSKSFKNKLKGYVSPYLLNLTKNQISNNILNKYNKKNILLKKFIDV